MSISPTKSVSSSRVDSMPPAVADTAGPSLETAERVDTRDPVVADRVEDAQARDPMGREASLTIHTLGNAPVLSETVAPSAEKTFTAGYYQVTSRALGTGRPVDARKVANDLAAKYPEAARELLTNGGHSLPAIAAKAIDTEAMNKVLRALPLGDRAQAVLDLIQKNPRAAVALAGSSANGWAEAESALDLAAKKGAYKDIRAFLDEIRAGHGTAGLAGKFHRVLVKWSEDPGAYARTEQLPGQVRRVACRDELLTFASGLATEWEEGRNAWSSTIRSKPFAQLFFMEELYRTGDARYPGQVDRLARIAAREMNEGQKAAFVHEALAQGPSVAAVTTRTDLAAALVKNGDLVTAAHLLQGDPTAFATLLGQRSKAGPALLAGLVRQQPELAKELIASSVAEFLRLHGKAMNARARGKTMEAREKAQGRANLFADAVGQLIGESQQAMLAALTKNPVDTRKRDFFLEVLEAVGKKLVELVPGGGVLTVGYEWAKRADKASPIAEQPTPEALAKRYVDVFFELVGKEDAYMAERDPANLRAKDKVLEGRLKQEYDNDYMDRMEAGYESAKDTETDGQN